MLTEAVPNDLRMSLYMDLTKHGSDEVKEMLRDKRLADKVLRVWRLVEHVRISLGRQLARPRLRGQWLFEVLGAGQEQMSHRTRSYPAEQV